MQSTINNLAKERCWIDESSRYPVEILQKFPFLHACVKNLITNNSENSWNPSHLKSKFEKIREERPGFRIWKTKQKKKEAILGWIDLVGQLQDSGDLTNRRSWDRDLPVNYPLTN